MVVQYCFYGVAKLARVCDKLPFAAFLSWTLHLLKFLVQSILLFTCLLHIIKERKACENNILTM
jgi:cytochrome c oxidase subunit IV